MSRRNTDFMHEAPRQVRIAIIGAGPAGLATAELLGEHGIACALYEAMPSPGRKFLMAGRGGLNLTHSEPLDAFVSRYGKDDATFAQWLAATPPDALRAWAHRLGIETFVGTSGRVFPLEMKAAPLLRAWLRRLREQGHQLYIRHRWVGWNADGALRFETPGGDVSIPVDGVVLAMGGGSWPQLGSDGRWAPVLAQEGVAVSPLLPANCGFEVAWSPYFAERFAGQALKNIAASVTSKPGSYRRGEGMITAEGIEGGLIYALSSALRGACSSAGSATLYLDLLPDVSAAQIAAALTQARGRRSLASHLGSKLSLSNLKFSLLREVLTPDAMQDNAQLAATLKCLPLKVLRPRPLAEAISSAGGVCFSELDDNLMLRHLPGVFCAGEMLDWEAPTGGYLLTGCIASGHAAARGILRWLAVQGVR